MSAALGLVALAVAALFATPAAGEPSSIQAKRAEVARIEGELAVLDGQMERATEAFNGARYRFGVVQDRIRKNRRILGDTRASLVHSRARLARRLRDLYRQPQPTAAEVILTSRSLSGAVDRLNALDRMKAIDGQMVGELRRYRDRLTTARAELLRDRVRRIQAVATARQQELVVTGLLRQRQAIYASARGELAQMIAAEQARQAQLAAIARQRALAAVQTQRQASAVSGTFSATGPGSSGVVAAPTGEGNGAAAALALQYLGTPYAWGGSAPGGFDCSGLASYVYGREGKDVPHYTGAIWSKYPHVGSGQLQSGDLVFFNGGGHMGIYVGNGQFVHAPHTGDVVKVSSLNGRSDYVGAVRP